MLYDESRYLWRNKFAVSRFEKNCLSEYAEVFKTVCVDAAYYTFPSVKYPTPVTKERVRRSLQTKSVEQARLLRDEVLERLEVNTHGTGNSTDNFSSLQEAA